MRVLMLLPLCLSLSGCYVAYSGHQSSGGGTTTTATGAAVRGQISTGSAQLGASFGTPPAPGTPGGQVSLSRGASALLLLGLVIGDTLNYLGATPAGSQPSAPRRGSIAETCSCYGWTPAAAPAND